MTLGIVSALGRNHLGINTLRELHPDRRRDQPGQLRRRAGRRRRQPGRHQHRDLLAVRRLAGHRLRDPGLARAQRCSSRSSSDGEVTRGWIGVEPQEITPEVAKTFKLRAPTARSSPACCGRPGRARGHPGARRRARDRGQVDAGRPATARAHRGTHARFERARESIPRRQGARCGRRRRAQAAHRNAVAGFGGNSLPATRITSPVPFPPPPPSAAGTVTKRASCRPSS